MNIATSETGFRLPKLNVSQKSWLAFRKVAKYAAAKFNAYVDYDVKMYEAMREIRPWQPGDIVFDVGANDGRSASRIASNLPNPRIFSFEPASNAFDTLKQTTRDLDSIELFKIGLGDKVETRTMYLNTRPVLNSLYSDWGDMHGQPPDADQPTEQIEISTVDHLIDDLGLDRINLLKVDTEGHDLKVLEGAAESLRAGRIDIIQVEAGFDVPGHDQPSLASMRAYLRETGYLLYGIYNPCQTRLCGKSEVKDASGNPPAVLTFCDALFVKSGWTPEKIV